MQYLLLIYEPEPTGLGIAFTLLPDTEVLDLGTSGDGIWEASARGGSDVRSAAGSCATPDTS